MKRDLFEGRPFPTSPGVYLMKDSRGEVIYVGKAKDLKKRIGSYFSKGGEKERYQVRFLMNRVADIDCIVTDTEKEALLLENNLIKRHRPRYNLQLRDDKGYLSLRISVRDRFPRLYVTRRVRKDGSLYFGPYTGALSARETVEFIERHFRIRTCGDQEMANRVRPCLQHQIHRCDAPCVGLNDEAGYRRVVDQVVCFLQGRNSELVKELEREMALFSERQEFEKAARTRDLILSIRETLEKQKVARHAWIDQDVAGFYREGERVTFCILPVRQGKVQGSQLFHLKGYGEDGEILETFLNQYYHEGHPPPDEILVPTVFSPTLSEVLSDEAERTVALLAPLRGERKQILNLASKNAREGFRRRREKDLEVREILSSLQEALHLRNFPGRIECFDISDTGGKEAVASLVSFIDGVPSREGYRRFRIKTVFQADDFAMMKEVLGRRLLHKGWKRPELIVLDGGKGHLNAVLAVMEELNVTGIDLIALAKEKEKEGDKVFLPGRKNPVFFGRHSSPLHLLMRVRDEAHRFAIAYHKKLRQKRFLPAKPASSN